MDTKTPTTPKPEFVKLTQDIKDETGDTDLFIPAGTICKVLEMETPYENEPDYFVLIVEPIDDAKYSTAVDSDHGGFEIVQGGAK